MIYRCLLLGLLTLSGCTVMEGNPGRPDQHNNMNAVLWVQTSTEYRSNSLTVYRAAAAMLPTVLAARGLTADLDQAASYRCEAGVPCDPLAAADLVPAVVLDIDETVLDNSRYQARLVTENGSYRDDTWDLWLAERNAPATPGVIEFVQQAQELGVAVIYLTNRTCRQRAGMSAPCPQRDDTLVNMKAEGIPALQADDQLIMRAERPEWDQSEKQLRRKYIGERYRIMMLIGDDLGDFGSAVKSRSLADRMAFAERHAALFGVHWFQLSNPIYGSWERAVPRPKSGSLIQQ